VKTRHIGAAACTAFADPATRKQMVDLMKSLAPTAEQD
jgi:hypothetical protein